MASTATYKCLCCGDPFTARTADRTHALRTQQPAPATQQAGEVRPVTPYTCPKCHALWLHWPAEQTGFGRDTLNCRSADHCHYCEKAGVEQLQRLERIPAALHAPQPAPTTQAAPAAGAGAGPVVPSVWRRRIDDAAEAMSLVQASNNLGKLETVFSRALSGLRSIQSTYVLAAAPTPAAQADSVRWMPLTPELLTAIESGDHGERFWLAAPSMSQPQIGDYEWRQGREPHGFNTGGGRWSASEITHVLPYKPPVLPAARNQGGA